MFELLREFHSIHKRSPRQDGKGYSKLNNWATKQRKSYKEGTLSQEKIELLEGLVGWEWNPFDDRWLSKFNLLVEYVDEHDSLPPARTPVIGPFCSRSRKEYKAGTLSQERINKFESISIWEWDIDKSKFMEKYRRIKAFLLEHGRLPDFSEDKVLGEWIQTVRRAYKRGDLEDYKKSLLDDLLDIGWGWSHEDITSRKWNDEFKDYCAFLHEHGRHPTKSDGRLSVWKDMQRVYIMLGKLSEDKIQKLESIDFPMPGARQRAWDENYHELFDFITVNMTLPDSNSRLGKWYQHQKEAFQKGAMPADRIESLMLIARRMGKTINEFLG